MRREEAAGTASTPYFNRTRRSLNVGSAASATVAALEALSAGDIEEAAAILEGALEDGPRGRRYRCPLCPADYEFPGLREKHLLVVHGGTDA
jgi:cellobiose-specific phosphotransferase system component IIA